MVYFVSYFSRKDFAAAMAAMLSANEIDRTIAGLVGTAMFVFYGVGQLLSGYLGDRIKPQYLITFGLATTGVCNLLMPILPETAMIVVWGVNGLAQAMLWPPIVKILSSYLDNKTYVTAHLAVTCAAHVATILLYVYVPVCLAVMSWKLVFISASVLAFVAGLIFVITLRFILPKDVRDESVEATSRVAKCGIEGQLNGNSGSLIKTFRSSGIFTIFVCIVICGFLRDGIESWLPTLYSEAFGRDASESTLLSVILPVFSVISIAIVTALHKRRLFCNEVMGAAVLFALSLLCAVPLVFTVSLDGNVFAVISLFLTALICAAMHGVNFLLISCLPGRFANTGRAATVSGVCNSCVYIGAAISTYGIAVISEAKGWSMTIGTWIALCAVGILFAVISYRKYSTVVNDG